MKQRTLLFPSLLGFTMSNSDAFPPIGNNPNNTRDLFADLEVLSAPDFIPTPRVKAWAKIAQAEPWLQQVIEELTSQKNSIADAAAAGVFARLWTPPSPDASMEARDLPRELVRAWVVLSTAEQREALEQHAVERAWSLSEDLEGVVTESVSGDAPTTGIRLQEIVQRRDDLQSVLRVLKLGGGGSRLADALGGVDAIATEGGIPARLSLPSADESGDRWMAVAWQEPEAWWSGVGDGDE